VGDETTRWWPRDHTRSSDPDVFISFEGRPGGRIFERTSDGIEHEWGQVVAWEPPHRLAYLWHIYGGPEDATEVAITFTGEGDKTTVTIVHTGWERLVGRASELRSRNHHAWESLISHYQKCLRTFPSRWSGSGTT
jgi:uncharacterized protein YndB with AHSA1/START domain